MNKYLRPFAAVLLTLLTVGLFTGRSHATAYQVYVSTLHSDLSTSLYQVASDGSSTNHVAYDNSKMSSFQATLSRDKSKVVMPSLDGVANYIIDSTSGNTLSNIPLSDAPATNFQWLNGNTSLIFVKQFTSGNYAIDSLNQDGSNRTQLVNTSNQDILACPAVQPQSGGNKIVYLEVAPTTSGTNYVRTMNSDGSGNSVVFSTGATVSYTCPVWSPNGAKLAYNIYASGNNPANQNNFVMVSNADGSGNTGLVGGNTGGTADGESATPANVWSPAMSSILYTAYNASGVQNLYYINVSTKAVTTITGNSSSSIHIDRYGWLPNGQIVYAYGGSGGDTIVKICNIDGSNSHVLFTAPSGETIDGLQF